MHLQLPLPSRRGRRVCVPANEFACNSPGRVKTRFKLKLKQPWGHFLGWISTRNRCWESPITLYTYIYFFHSQLSIYFVCSAHMKLTIRNLQYGDFGNYRCISKNSLGETEGSIRVYGKCICIGSLSAAVAASKHTYTHTYRERLAHTISNAISSALCATILPKAFTYVPQQRPQGKPRQGDGVGVAGVGGTLSSSDMCTRRTALKR